MLAIPLGIMGAVYLHEYGKHGRLARFIRFMTDVMTGVPSVIMGVFIYSIWVLPRGVDGRSAWAASLALACLMLPIVVRSTEEMLRAGARTRCGRPPPRWGPGRGRPPSRSSCPRPSPGSPPAALLAVARAAGETAPVVFVIGFVTTTNLSLTGPEHHPVARRSTPSSRTVAPLATQLAWGAAVTLVGIVLVLTLVARAIRVRFEIR